MSAERASSDAFATRRREGSTRTLLRVGAVVAVFGIAFSAGGDPTLGRWFALGGIVALVVGLHRFGRMGADPPLELESTHTDALVRKPGSSDRA